MSDAPPGLYDMSKTQASPLSVTLAMDGEEALRRYMALHRHFRACLFEGPLHGEVLKIEASKLLLTIEYTEEPDVSYALLNPYDRYAKTAKRHVYRLKRVWDEPHIMAALYVHWGK